MHPVAGFHKAHQSVNACDRRHVRRPPRQCDPGLALSCAIAMAAMIVMVVFNITKNMRCPAGGGGRSATKAASFFTESV
jgi:hypothetical protein